MRVILLPVFLLPFLLPTEAFGYPAHSQHSEDVAGSSIHPRTDVDGSHASDYLMSGALNPPSNLRDLCSPTRGGVKRITHMPGPICALRYGSRGAVWLADDSGLCLVSSTSLRGVSGKGTCIVEIGTKRPGIGRSASFSNAERPENPADWRHKGVVDVSDSPDLHKCESGFLSYTTSYAECKTLEGSKRWFRNPQQPVPTKVTGTCCHKDLVLKVQIGDEPHVLQGLCRKKDDVRAVRASGFHCALTSGHFAWRPEAPKSPLVPPNDLCLSRPMDYARFKTPGVCYCHLPVSRLGKKT